VKPGAESAPLAQSLPLPAETAPLRRGETADAAPLSWLVACNLGGRAEEARESRDRRELVERLERKRKNARSLVHGLEQRLAASEQWERVQQDGELVKANLHRIARGAKSVEVEDFFAQDAAARTIALEPKLSPHENLQRIFERAKKLERARSVVGEELAMARAKLAALESFLARAEAAGADFDALAREAVDARVLEPQQQAPAGKKPVVVPRVPYKTFRGFAGGEIRVGRTAKDNDELTFRHASGNDVWMHTADTPGSHVVLRVEKGAEPHPEELLDAAHLAVHFSPISGATRARVHTARRKEVHKPRGAKPGLVTLSGGKILEVRMQPARLQRLLGTHRPPAGTD
jgi:predicted ribosome quality control (RQC) complex YloA/Tae2 family protein